MTSDTMVKLPEPPMGRGKIVALEGPPEVVAAQLRLLPVSSQIMVLPNLQQYLSDANIPPPVTIRQLIYHVHIAAKKRHAQAVAFLEEAAADKKRVVFLNGGTVGARVLCLSAISHNRTDGDLEKAEVILNELMSEGVASLLDDKEAAQRDSALHRRTNIAEEELWEKLGGGDIDRFDDPILRAMRAADALDKETESLQSPTNEEVDTSACWFNNSKTWSRGSLKLPFMNFGPSARSPQLPAGPSQAHYSRSTQRSLLTSVEDLLAERMRGPPSSAQSSAQWPLETKIPTSTLSWVTQTPELSLTESPSTTDLLPLKRSASAGAPPSVPQPDQADEKRAASVELGILGTGSQAELPPLKQPRRKRPPLLPLVINTQTTGLRAVRSLGNLEAETATERSDTRPQLCDKNIETTSFLQSFPYCEEVKHKDGYVDKATDTADLDGIAQPKRGAMETRPFEEVLPLLENLVIQLIGDIPNPPLERIFEGFRNGPAGKETMLPGLADTSASAPSTPIDAFVGMAFTTDLSSEPPVSALGAPFTANGSHDGEMMHGALGYPHAQLAHGRLPTPPYDLYLPATPKQGLDQRFQTLSVRRQTDTAVQNTLRLILSSYIPSEVWTQYPSRTVGSRTGTSWKPVLWKPEPQDGWRSCEELDMILAIGAERSVKQGYTSAVVRQVEKLGLVSGGSRSGRLDLRYLIANAMQDFTCLPLTKQTRDSPFSNSDTLASLLMPHLESYLAAHPQVRFLILEYTADHLPTVLALRKLIGTESVKVAGIVSGEARPSTAPSGFERDSFAELRSVSGLEAFNNHVSPKSTNAKFNKANYILTSSATQGEISAFVSAIRDTLITKSAAYKTADVDTRAHTPRRSGTKSKVSHLKQESTFLSTSTLDTPPASPRDFYATAPQSPLRSSSSLRSGSGSIIPSTTTSENRDKLLRGGVFLSSAASRLRSLTPSTMRSKASTTTLPIYDEEEYEAEERRLMPLYLRREAEKGNTEKARKWLGLTV
ncbi:hypothetical protein QBC34DRAFT_72179 [Podospora aff. communis PSN243]|uniref:Uncharacterized protein n=1 Tax=Podospora aff. communis PSN243 TaxID=3040156 RepID=A0AAV9H4S5_9PEZI|nr:hypothetical protein QBC34DRAFT_72179 [Podospora aff. communis PSN243]